MATNELKFNVTVDGANVAVDRIKSINGTLETTTKMLPRIRKAFAEWGLAIHGVERAFAGVKTASNYLLGASAEVEAMKLRLEGLYQSSEKATQAFTRFEDVAKRTPATLQQVAIAGATLKAFGLDAETTLESAVDLASYMGMDLVEAASAIGRSFAGGAAASEIFRERGVLALIKSFSGIDDLTQLTLPEFRRVMLETLVDPSIGIAGSANRISKSYAGAMSNMQDAMFRLRTEVFGKLLPQLTKLLRAGISVLDWITQMDDAVRGLLFVLPLATVAWYKIAAAQITVATASGALTTALAASLTTVKAFLTTIGPVGWALMAASAGVGIYAIAARNAADANEIMATDTEMAKKAAHSQLLELASLTEKLKELRETTDGSAKSKQGLRDVVREINAGYGKYLGNIDLEKASWDKVAIAVSNARGQLIEYQMMQIYEEKYKKQIQNLASLRIAYDELTGANESYQEALDRGSRGDGVMGGGLGDPETIRKANEAQNKEIISSIKSQIVAGEKELKRAAEAYRKSASTLTGGDAGDGGESVSSVTPLENYYSRMMHLNASSAQEVVDSHNEMRDSLWQYLEATVTDLKLRDDMYATAEAEIAASQKARLTEIRQNEIDAERKLAAEMLGIKVAALQDLEGYQSEYLALRFQQIDAETEKLRKAGLDQVTIAAWVASERAKVQSEANPEVESKLTELQEIYAAAGRNIRTSLEGTIGNTLHGLMTTQQNFADAMRDLWKNLANSVIAEISRMIAKMLILKIISTLTGVPMGGSGGIGLGDSGVPGTIFGTRQYTGGSQPQSFAPMAQNQNNVLANRIDRLIVAIENNQPQIYTQKIEGIPFYNAIRRAEMVTNEL